MGESDLRKLYPPTVERARLKTQFKLDKHSRNFIARSPFVCIGSSSERGADVTPRGDEPGFVLVLDDTTLAVPDWPGNNRLDSFSNIVLNPQVALLFLIPGVDETLRASGTAEIRTSSELLEGWLRIGDACRSRSGASQRRRVRHTKRSQAERHDHAIPIRQPACLYDSPGQEA